jgi:hypothetical protein
VFPSRWQRQLLCFMVIGILCAIASQGQSHARVSKPAGRIALGGGSGSPGDSLIVPVYFTAPEGIQVGQLTIMVNFVSANLKFKKVGKGIAAEMSDVDVSSSEKTDKNDKGVEVSTVTLTASAPAGGTSNKGITGGLLAYLALDVSNTARPANITLRTSAEATELASNKKLEPPDTVDAKIEVIAPGDKPLTDCFFFSH